MTLNLDLNCVDTICAPATPTGKSALSLVRVSGPDAEKIRDQIFKSKKGTQKPFVATFGDIVDENTVVDEAVCTFFPDKRSFTGEPSFELSTHGNPLIVQRVLSLLYKCGCRAAGPGEFSLRSFIHGKMDLSQAEAIADVIDAQSPQGVQVALKNLKGGLELSLHPIRNAILSTLCEIEARLDFPDEGIGEKHKLKLIDDLNTANQWLANLVLRSNRVSKLMHGFRVVLYGKPNVGKSTLLNTLVGEERSIVHETEGTTRDVLEVNWQLGSIPVVLVDVAGIREGEEIHPVELMGIERAKNELERADLVLILNDASAPTQDAFSNITAPYLRVFTKSDLLSFPLTSIQGLTISAKTGTGIDELIAKIEDVILSDLPDPNSVLLTRQRHIDLVKSSCGSLTIAIDSFQSGAFDECVAFELREAGRFLDELLGKQMNEEVLDLIFSRFCIGK